MTSLSRYPHLRTAARALTVLRLILGLVLVIAGQGKMDLAPLLGPIPVPVVAAPWQRELPERLGEWLTVHPDGVSAAVVRDLMIPRGAFFAAIIAWGQLLTGILLVLGLFTRWAGGAAALLLGILAMAASQGGSAPGMRAYLLLAAIAIVVAFGNAGQTMGVDGWRRERNRG